jgi:hypothetical protein
MSILTIGRDEIERRKATSDLKDDAFDLTLPGASTGSRGVAYKAVREYHDDKQIKEITELFDNAKYYECLLND